MKRKRRRQRKATTKSKWLFIKRMKGFFGSDYYLKVNGGWETLVNIHTFEKVFGLKLKMDEVARVRLEVKKKLTWKRS